MQVNTIRLSRRAALRSLAAAAVLSTAFVAPFSLSRASAQQEQDVSFSNTILPTLGLPELNLEQTADGIVGVPESIEAGRYLVNYTSTDVVGYLLFAQHPADLTPEQVLEQGRLAGSMDQQQPGWVYGGGTYGDPGKTVQVVVELKAGDWKVINSAMPPDGNWETDEKYAATPLTVTEASVASPVPALDATAHVDMPGMAYVLQEEVVPAGPQVWEFKNTGDQAHHMVMMRTPKLVTSDDMNMLFDAFASGTPPAGDNWYMNSAWVGYTALVSPGYTVWNEFDLEPGTYLMLCYIEDIESGMPHMMMGMYTPFTVE
jgi:hypothetical protein